MQIEMQDSLLLSNYFLTFCCTSGPYRSLKRCFGLGWNGNLSVMGPRTFEYLNLLLPSFSSWREKKKEYTKRTTTLGRSGISFFWKEMFRDRERLKAEMGGGRKRKGEEENRYLLDWSERASERERERMECKKREWTSGRDWLKGHLRQGPRQRLVLCTVLPLHIGLASHTHTHTHLTERPSITLYPDGLSMMRGERAKVAVAAVAATPISNGCTVKASCPFCYQQHLDEGLVRDWTLELRISQSSIVSRIPTSYCPYPVRNVLAKPLTQYGLTSTDKLEMDYRMP